LRTRDDTLDRRRVEWSVHRDDPAECGALVAFQRALIRGRKISGNGNATRVGVLDDRAGRTRAESDSPKIVHQAPRRVGVVEVEV